MTQANINLMDIVVDQLAEGKTISKALKKIYSKRKVVIPYNEDIFDVDVTKLKMSIRTKNVLLHFGIKTLKNAVDVCCGRGETNIKNLGKSAGVELFETILDYCWGHMSEKEKTEFLIDTIERNVDNVKSELL